MRINFRVVCGQTSCQHNTNRSGDEHHGYCAREFIGVDETGVCYSQHPTEAAYEATRSALQALANIPDPAIVPRLIEVLRRLVINHDPEWPTTPAERDRAWDKARAILKEMTR